MSKIHPVRLPAYIVFFVGAIMGHAQATPPSFPGAQGFGAIATGARGYTTVYHVTNLNDSGAGSFRTGASGSNQTIVFDVGGYVQILSPISVGSNLTIAGQTAPGQGIGIFGAEMSFSNGSNCIVRYMRFRDGTFDPNYPGTSGTNSSTNAMNLYNTNTMIFDHCSLEFGAYNDVDSTSAIDITVQNCIIADPILAQQFNFHLDTGPGTFIGNIFANSHNRSILAKASLQFINNVDYNYQAGFTTGNSAAVVDWDFIGNDAISGPSTTSVSDAYYQVDNNQSAYATGNLINGSAANTIGSANSLSSIYFTSANAPTCPTANIPMVSATTALVNNMANSGTLPRDQVDAQVISDVESNGSLGRLYGTQADTGLGNSGYGTITGGDNPKDTDQDGMPDFWETAMGFNPNSAADGSAQASDGSGYTNLEEYLNWLAGPHASMGENTSQNPTSAQIDLSQYTTGLTNATYTVNSITTGTAILPAGIGAAATTNSGTVTVSGSMATYTPAANTVGLGGFTFTATGSNGTISGTVYVVTSVTLEPVPGTWTGGDASNGNWSDTDNWASGGAPGATSGVNSTGVATFNTAVSAGGWGNSGSPVVIDQATQNIDGITFDTAAGNYTIGTTSGNPLLLTSGGTIQILAGLSSTNAQETINAPLVLEGGFTLANYSAPGTGFGAGSISISGGVTAASGVSATLTLAGTNTNASSGDENVVNSVIGNGSGTLSVATSGSGTWVLTSVNTYTGTTTVGGGILQLNSGGVINSASAVNVVAGQLVDNGGSLTTAVSSNITSGSNGLLVEAGTTSFNGGLTTDAGANNANLISVTGGTLTASSLYLGRTGLDFSTQALAETGDTSNGLIINGGTVNITGNLNMGTSAGTNSSANTQVDKGSLTVGGTTTITINNGSRFSVFDVAGGTFTDNDTTGVGVKIGGVYAATADEFYITGGTVNTPAVTIGDSTQTSGSDILHLAGGALYVGTGGIVNGETSGTTTNTLSLTGGTLGAAGNWSSSMNMALGGTTIQTANASGTPFNISLGGVLSGTTLNKTGTGTLTLSGANTYTGATTVSGGELIVTSNLTTSSLLTTASGATLDLTGANVSTSGTITNNGTLILGAGVSLSSTGSFTNNGTINLTSDPTYILPSNFVNHGTVVGASLPAAPTNPTAVAGSSDVMLTWTASTGAAHYVVQRSTVTGGPYATVTSTVIGTSYTDSGLNNGTTYYYVVAASNGNGIGANSTEVNATPTSAVDGGSQAWSGGGATDGDWSDGDNWSGGSSPGATSGVASADVATFNTAISAGTWGNGANNPVVMDQTTQNIGTIAFDAAAGNYFIGKTTGNSLLLSSGGTIQILSTLSSTNAQETINAPLLLEGNYTLANNSAGGAGVGAGTLNIGGGITTGSGATVLTLSGSNTNANTISGVIGNGSGAVTVTEAGLGTWYLTGTNTYAGGTTVSAGTLQIGNGTSGSISATGSTAVSSGATLAFDQANNGSFAGNITDAGTVLGAEASGITNTLSGVISGAGGFTQSGAGETIFTGVNTYTGKTTVNGGLLNLVFGATTGNTNNISSSSALTLRGGELFVTNSTTFVTNTQTFNGTTVNGGASAVTVDRISNDVDTVSFGGVTEGTAGTMLISPVNVGSSNIVFKTSTTATNGILGGWAVYGNGVPASGFAVPSATAMSSFTPTAETTSWGSSTTNVGEAATATVNSGSTANSLTFTNTTGNVTLTLAGTNTLNSGGILVPSTVTTGNMTITGGTLVGGPASAGGALYINQYSGGTPTAPSTTGGTLTINSVIANNGTNPTALVKTGESELILGGANTFTGGVYLNQGTLEVTASGALNGNLVTFNSNPSVTPSISSDIPVAAPVLQLNVISATVGGLQTQSGYVGGTPIVENGIASTAVSLTITNTTPATFTGIIENGGTGTLGLTLTSGTQTLSGANTYTGGTTISGGTLTVATGGTLGTGGVLAVNTGGTLSLGANVTVGAVTLGGGTISGTGALTGTSYTSTGGTISASLAGSVSFTNTSGTTTLSGANSYTGATTVNGGTLTVATGGTLGAGGALTVNTGGTLSLGANVTVGAVTLGGGTISGVGALTGTSYTSTGGTISASLAGSVSFTNTSGTTTLSGTNSYTGATIVSGGELIITANFTSSSSISIASGATLDLTGANVSTSGTITNNGTLVLGNGVTLSSTGTFTNNGTLDLTNDPSFILPANFVNTGTVLTAPAPTSSETPTMPFWALALLALLLFFTAAPLRSEKKS